jgi:ABC-type polysaccharide/polyol phosphate export permease
MALSVTLKRIETTQGYISIIARVIFYSSGIGWFKKFVPSTRQVVKKQDNTNKLCHQNVDKIKSGQK